MDLDFGLGALHLPKQRLELVHFGLKSALSINKMCFQLKTHLITPLHPLKK